MLVMVIPVTSSMQFGKTEHERYQSVVRTGFILA